MGVAISEIQGHLEAQGQDHVLRFWDSLNTDERASLLQQLESIDFQTVNRLISEWILNEPPTQDVENIETVPVIPPVEPDRADCREALQAGEDALRADRVGIITVAGGQGTRLGFDGPKGAFPIGPITGRTLFDYHADKIRNLQRRYGCTLPWYIMVSEANAEETRAFFEENRYFDLSKDNVYFFPQGMMPCVDDQGKLMLDTPGRLAMNPNGHGGCILALVEKGIIADARKRGIDTLSYIQVDNWAVKVADPYFVGFHLLHGSEMSSKIHRKTEVRESVGVHCKCDGAYCVIEYSELELYPQLLERDEQGKPVHFAGNPAIHVLDVDFIEQVYHNFRQFPWHRAHKKIPYVDKSGNTVEPDAPNGYKFETFIFDALQFVSREPVYLEITREGEYTPIKQHEGPNSVAAARALMREYWGRWIEAAGYSLPRDAEGCVTVDIEISPDFALTQEEFVENSKGKDWPIHNEPVAIGPAGNLLYAAEDT